MTFSLLFLQFVRMPTYQFPCSLVALFPESVYKNAGVADVLPLVMQSLDPDKVQCAQLLRDGRVRLTFDDPESCAAVLKSGLNLGDVAVQLFPADERVRLVHLRDLPIEVGHDAVSSFFSTYGEVLSVDHCYFKEFPSVRNGNRLIKILLTQDIPYFIEIESCNCRVWYRRQPSQCSICREFGHRAQACSLSGRCRRCRQPGHMARECTQAWGSPPPVSIDVDVDDSSTSDSATVPDPVSAVITDKTSDPELPLCSTMPVDKSVDKLPVNNSSVVMTNDVADKPVDKPPALLSWPRSTIPGTTIVRDFLPLAAAGPKHHSFYGSVRGFIQKMTPAQFMKMPTLELKTSITDFLWTRNISPDIAVLEGLLLRLSKLKKALEKL